MESLDALAQHFRRRTFPARTTLFHQDDPGLTLYLIVSGRVRIERTEPVTGETVHLADRGPGEHIGEMALLEDAPRFADGVTLEPTDLLMLDRAEFLVCFQRHPTIPLAIIRSLSARLRASDAALLSHRTQDATRRLARFLLEQADAAGVTELPIRWTQKELAERIGASKESVQRALTRFRESGAAYPSENGTGRLLIADARRLQMLTS